jgi:hypothetical protein
MTEVFRDMGQPDDAHWVLFQNGTFYTFPKQEFPNLKNQPGAGDDLVARALDMSKNAELLKYNDNDCVTVLKYPEFHHPTYVVLSCLRQKIGWIVIGKTETWADTEQQLAAVGYLARTHYEMDCHENKILATSFPWSAQDEP